MTGRHARRPRPDMQTYWDADENSDLPGRPARNYFDVLRSMSSDPEVLAAVDRIEARAGLTEQARRQRIAIPPDPPTGRYKRRCGHRMPGLFGAELVCIEPRRHRLPHRNAGGTEWWPRSRWARLAAWLTERFTPVKEEQ